VRYGVTGAIFGTLKARSVDLPKNTQKYPKTPKNTPEHPKITQKHSIHVLKNTILKKDYVLK
jgi:hypothetical protein